jgi:hypothetical protein
MDNKNRKSLRQTLDITLAELVKTNQDNENSGACIFTPPSGKSTCLQLTSSQCEAIGGMYIGGSCSEPNIESNKSIGETNNQDSPIVDNEIFDDKDCNCNYGGQTYTKGAIICIGRKQYKCTCSGWSGIGFKC